MGIFGHGGHLSKAGHAIEKGVSHTAHEIGRGLKHWDTWLRNHGAPDMYIGGTYDKNGFTPNIKITPNIIDTGIPQTPQIQKTGYNYGNVGRSNTTAYQANVAGTTNKIAQGGMTKDDILKYNIKHPNEIAGDPAPNNTALNTNTALRS